MKTIRSLILAHILMPLALAERITLPGPDDLQLKGEWLVAPNVPAPAVVLLHGCGGVYGKDGAIQPRHAAMAQFLNEHGYSVLLLDSFSPRGIKQICTVKFGERGVKVKQRALDALAALDWLSSKPEVTPGQIGLLGWSNGGSTTLRTLVTVRPAPAPRFAAAVALYPGCSSFTQQRYQPNAPLLLLIGEADDWTAAAPCHQLAEQAKAANAVIAVHGYADTYHDFDNPALKAPRHRADVPNGVRPGAGVTIAPNPEAAKDAWRRVAEWFAQHFEPTRP